MKDNKNFNQALHIHINLGSNNVIALSSEIS